MKNTAPKAIPQRDSRGRFTDGNPGNTGGKKGRSGRRPADFRGWVLAARDKHVRKVVEEILRDPTHRDRFRAVEFVTRCAGEVEKTLTGDEIAECARMLVKAFYKHVPEPERVAAIQAELDRFVDELA